MTPRELERLLLLEQSGELSEKQRGRLEAECAANAGAQHRRAELCRLAAALPPVSAEPSPATVEKIFARLAPPHAPATAFLPQWKPALAAAAALALLLGIHAFRKAAEVSPLPAPGYAALGEEEEDDWIDPLEEEFAELEQLILVLSEDEDLFDWMEL